MPDTQNPIAMQLAAEAMEAPFRLTLKSLHSRVLRDVNDLITRRLRAVNVPITRRLVVVIDGGGQPITNGTKATIAIHDKLRVVHWDLAADTTGSINIDLKRATYANWPTTTSIVAGTGPQLASSQKNSADVAPAAWSTLLDGDMLDVVVTSSSTVQRVTLSLACYPTT